MEKSNDIIHEPHVPRLFRLLAESEKEGNGLVTYGLKDPFDNTFTFWNGSILMDDGRLFELSLECDQEYPKKPPKIKFVTKVNVPFVDGSGRIKDHSIPCLKNWTTQNTLETYLTCIRNELKNQLKNYPQPPEGSKY